ncbi:MAG: hypothetical protein V4640_06915 [Verrucomicrobiota bacterium]
MSWTDHFPVLGDNLIAAWQNLAKNGEVAEIEACFAIREWINLRPARHLVSASLFWKPAYVGEQEFPPLTRELLRNPRSYGIATRENDPWGHYVAPLLDGAAKLWASRPDITFRVYLAADLDFLIGDLTAVGCEIVLMESCSLRHNPGAMWRFLALEGDTVVTVTDADRARDVIHDVTRTEAAVAAGLGSWRSPYTWGPAATHSNIAAWYRPINACQFGTNACLPMRVLAEAFVWSVKNGMFPTAAPVAFGAAEEFFGSGWPGYGFDEWFLLCAVYPRLAAGGMLTVIRPGDHTLHHLFALDIEYCTWANPASEIVYLPWKNAAEDAISRTPP